MYAMLSGANVGVVGIGFRKARSRTREEKRHVKYPRSAGRRGRRVKVVAASEITPSARHKDYPDGVGPAPAYRLRTGSRTLCSNSESDAYPALRSRDGGHHAPDRH